MIMNVQEIYIKFLQIYKNVQPVQNLYRVHTDKSLKLEMYVFCTYKQYTNYTKCIRMLIESYAAADVCFLLPPIRRSRDC